MEHTTLQQRELLPIHTAFPFDLNFRKENYVRTLFADKDIQ